MFGNPSAPDRGLHSIRAVDAGQTRVILCRIVTSPRDLVTTATITTTRLCLKLRHELEQ